MAEQYSVQAENLMKTAVEEYIDVLKDIKATDANLTVIQNIRVSVSGKPRRWRVENSWGVKGGDKGYYLMTDEWFDEYNYEVVIDEKYLSKYYKIRS